MMEHSGAYDKELGIATQWLKCIEIVTNNWYSNNKNIPKNKNAEMQNFLLVRNILTGIGPNQLYKVCECETVQL